MKNICNSLLVIFLISLFTNVYAQEKSGVSIHLGGILPMGSFTQNPSYIIPAATGDRCGAIFGASLGLRYNYTFANTRIEDSGVGIFISADAFWNYINKDMRDAYDLVKCTKPMYLNVPIMVGVSWTSDFVSSPVNVWAEAGLGCDIFLKTTEGWSGNTVSYNINPEFACEGGIGLIINKLFSVGVHYYWLGKQDIKAKGVNYGDGFLAAPQVAIHMMAFKVGFHF